MSNEQSFSINLHQSQIPNGLNGKSNTSPAVLCPGFGLQTQVNTLRNKKIKLNSCFNPVNKQTKTLLKRF
jgi:hypothetical protein